MTRHPLRTFALALMLATLGCAEQPVDDADGPAWSLVALYDGATAARLGAHPPGESFTWQAWPELEAACGRPKGPVGLGGEMDAELMARAQEPYLVILLAGPAGVPVTNRSTRVFVGDPRTPFWLAPAVVPRALSLNVAVEATVDAPGPDATKMVEQLRSQLTVQLCLEHQVGRGWEGLGGIAGLTARDMQNTFMLDKVPSEDRRLFVGQGASAAPLLGPPWWAPRWEDPSNPEPVQVSGTALSASDLFAFSPPRASGAASPAWRGSEWPDRWLDLALGGPDCPDCAWVPAGGEGTTELDLTVHRGACGLELSAQAHLGSGERIAWLGGERAEIPVVVPGDDLQTLPDVLRSVPYEYPRFESTPNSGDPPDRALAVLLIPNWQLANAAIEQESGALDWKQPVGSEPRDGVGWILEHPELLHVIEVPTGVSLDTPSTTVARGPGEDCGPAAPSPEQTAAGPDVQVIELMAGLHKPRRLGQWGPSPDFRANAAPIVAAGVDDIEPRQQRAAVRRGTGALTLLAGLILIVFGVPGLLRLPNLWSARPRERAWGWPSQKEKSAQELVDDASKGGS